MSAKQASDMSATGFHVWMLRNGLDTPAAAERLGVTTRQIQSYLNGSCAISVMLKLACLAIEHNLDA